MSVDVTVTIVSWNTKELLRRCLNSIYAYQSRSAIEIHVVDNASADGSIEMLREQFPSVNLIENKVNVGFAAASNQSWRQSKGRYWLLLNSDTEVREAAVDALVAFMNDSPHAGLATARLLNPDGTPQHCAQRIPGLTLTLLEAGRLHKLLTVTRRATFLLGPYWTYDRRIRVGWTWGTALIARRSAVDEVGPLNEDFFMYGEDLEWCLRMRRQGWEVWFCPDAEVIHHGAQSARQRWDETSHRLAILDGIYRAMGIHSSRTYVALLHLISFAALCSNRGLGGEVMMAARMYHMQAFKRLLGR